MRHGDKRKNIFGLVNGIAVCVAEFDRIAGVPALVYDEYFAGVADVIDYRAALAERQRLTTKKGFQPLVAVLILLIDDRRNLLRVHTAPGLKLTSISALWLDPLYACIPVVPPPRRIGLVVRNFRVQVKLHLPYEHPRRELESMVLRDVSQL